jgi:hypothetical protein
LQGGQRFAGVLAAGGGAGGVVVKGCGLVSAETADAGYEFGYGSGGDQVGVRTRGRATRHGGYGRADRRVSEHETALLAGSGGDDVVHEHGQITSGNTPGRTTEIGEGGRVAIAVGRAIIGDRGGGDGAHNFGRGSFIRGNLGAQKTGDGNRGDDQDDGYDDEEFDERKSALTV